jgi:hypothetical protein
MTSFFLLEADGTSKVTLEDASGSVVGEDHVAAAGAIMNQLQGSNLGADLYNGTLMSLMIAISVVYESLDTL